MSSIKEFKKLFVKAETDEDRHEVMDNLIIHLLESIKEAGDRSPKDALETVKSCDRQFREFSEMDSRIPFDGFRTILAKFESGPSTQFLYDNLGWPYFKCLQSPPPWEKFI